ncbi:MAG: sensor histidine kinase [Pseudomonadota bacterium]
MEPAASPDDLDDLATQLARQHEELRTLARRLITVQEDERAALSRELHDDIGQSITAIKLSAVALLGEADPRYVREVAQEIVAIADQTVAKLRDLSLLLRPPQLDALGLEAALRWQAGALFRGDGPALTLDVPPLPCRPPRAVELACFRIAQEALTNALRHAHARHVLLRLDCDDTTLRLHVEDDGRGLAPDRRDGLGLITMRERAEQLRGTFAIRSNGRGTAIDVELPLDPA